MVRRVLILPAVKAGSAHGSPGRPCKLADPHRRKTLLEALEAGNTRKAACAYAGLSEDAFGRYRAEHEDFDYDVQEAEAKAVIRNVERIQQAADKDWHAAAWLLERRFPEEWGRKRLTILTGANGGQLKVEDLPFDLTKLTDHELEVFKQLVEKIDQRTGRPSLAPPADGQGNPGHR